jgi:hypothetical protein
MVNGDAAAYMNVIVASNALGSNPFECAKERKNNRHALFEHSGLRRNLPPSP